MSDILYAVSFKNFYREVETLEEAMELRARWTKGHPRRMVERHFHINQVHRCPPELQHIIDNHSEYWPCD